NPDYGHQQVTDNGTHQFARSASNNHANGECQGVFLRQKFFEVSKHDIPRVATLLSHVSIEGCHHVSAGTVADHRVGSGRGAYLARIISSLNRDIHFGDQSVIRNRFMDYGIEQTDRFIRTCEFEIKSSQVKIDKEKLLLFIVGVAAHPTIATRSGLQQRHLVECFCNYGGVRDTSKLNASSEDPSISFLKLGSTVPHKTPLRTNALL